MLLLFATMAAFMVSCKQSQQKTEQSGTAFKGDIQLDVRDSKADWAPYERKKAPEGSPNILFILYDDTGLGAWSPYGGRIKYANNG